MSNLMKTAQTQESDMQVTEEAKLASFWNQRFRDAMVAKSEYTIKWGRYIDAYNGDYFKSSTKSEYKSDLVSNYIFSIVETIRPIMLDNDPKFQCVPRQPDGMDYSNDINESLAYEWDREKMSEKLYRELITTLKLGTSVFFLPWDSNNKQVHAIPVNPFNLFPDPLATGVDDAEYIIYASYIHEGILKRTFEEHADKIRGSQINYSELVQDNNETGTRIDKYVLVLEAWAKDYSYDEYEVDGYKKRKMKYPNGRVLQVAPELNLVLSDKANPYKGGGFPFVLFKDYDVPNRFWGEGEVAQLLSPQTYMNELNNSIIDNAKHTANVPWIIDKNSGIGQGKITNRPGLVIRKNPGTSVERPQPPSMPAYVNNAVAELKGDMEQISGVFDTLKGNSETGVYTAQGILALQEAGQARIRLKVKLLEISLGKLGTMWHERMKQYWKDTRWMRITRADGTYDFKKLRKAALDQEYDIKITAGSTIAVNRGAMLDLMVRLAQTQMPDGQPLVDREAVVQFLPEEVKSSLLRRMKGGNQQIEQVEQQVEQLAQADEQITTEFSSALEEMTGAIEKLNAQILQLQKEHDTMVEKDAKEKELAKVRDKSYNEGFADAEKQTQSQADADESALFSDDEAVPEYDEEFLMGLENLSDDELQLLVEQNPDIATLINNAQ